MRGYSNIDWGSDLDESKSTLGHAFNLSGRAMSWCGKEAKLHNNVSYGGRLCVLYHKDKKHCH